MTSSHRLDLKPYIEQKEDIEHGGRRRQSSTKHGDRALAIIGDDRISLTEEDVRCKRFLETHEQSILFPHRARNR